MDQLTKKALKNPLLNDFTVEYDKHGANPKTLTIPAGEIKEFEEPYFSHIKRHLASEVLHERGMKRTGAVATLKEINEEIELDI